MGRLAGYRYRDVIRRLGKHGFILLRRGNGSHEIWVNEATRGSFTISSHSGDVPEGTLRSILRQAGIAEDDFLA